METIKVIIENLPTPDPWYIKFAPTFIGFVALIISGFSIYYTKKAFIRNSRPYVWALNFATLNNTNQIINSPETIALRVRNVPAKVLKQEIKILVINQNNETTLFEKAVSNQVRFPDEKSQWTYNIGKNEYNAIFQNLSNDQIDNELRRTIKITYTSLDSSKKYSYELIQKFNRLDNQWSDLYETAK